MRFVLWILLSCSVISAQVKKMPNDFSFSLHEETINKVLAAVGEISGSNDYEVMFIKGKYHWTIQNPQIKIRPDSSQFDCIALVNVGPFAYKTNVNGHVKITYDKKNDKIAVKITRAIFELYTVILNKKFHLKDIHLEDYFKDPFLFDGPKSYGTSMDVSMPDSTIKKIYLQPDDCELLIKWQEICTMCEIIASDKPVNTKPQAGSTSTKTPAPAEQAPKAADTSTVPATKKTSTTSARKK